MRIARGLPAAGLAVLAACGGENPDLTRAIGGGAGRRVTPAPAPAPHEWVELGAAHTGNDTLRLWPSSLCMTGDRLLVGDGARRRITTFTPDGRPLSSFGGPGTQPGTFTEITVVRCAPGSRRVAVGDRPLHRVSVFDVDSGFVSGFTAPESPQVRVLGDLAPRAGGGWYSSWLGSALPLGPYLDAKGWDSVGLVQTVEPDGSVAGQIGVPAAYRDPVARRVLNRTFLAVRRDTVWVLTQGDATLRGIAPDGSGTAIRLPVHHRGREPKVKVGPRLGPQTEFRDTRFAYHPNVQALGMVHDSLFATLRYRKWGYRLVGTGWDRSIQPRAQSAVEVFDRSGRVVQSLAVPGHAVELASTGGARVAVLTRMNDGSQRVLLGTLPSFPRTPP